MRGRRRGGAALQGRRGARVGTCIICYLHQSYLTGNIEGGGVSMRDPGVSAQPHERAVDSSGLL
jgi:hypothetical protein